MYSAKQIIFACTALWIKTQMQKVRETESLPGAAAG